MRKHYIALVRLALPPVACRSRTFRPRHRRAHYRRGGRKCRGGARPPRRGHAQRWRDHPTALQLRGREEVRPELSRRHAGTRPAVATLTVSKPTSLSHLSATRATSIMSHGG